jgi:hypothetical protein
MVRTILILRAHFLPKLTNASKLHSLFQIEQSVVRTSSRLPTDQASRTNYDVNVGVSLATLTALYGYYSLWTLLTVSLSLPPRYQPLTLIRATLALTSRVFHYTGLVPKKGVGSQDPEFDPLDRILDGWNDHGLDLDRDSEGERKARREGKQGTVT